MGDEIIGKFVVFFVFLNQICASPLVWKGHKEVYDLIAVQVSISYFLEAVNQQESLERLNLI